MTFCITAVASPSIRGLERKHVTGVCFAIATTNRTFTKCTYSFCSSALQFAKYEGYPLRGFEPPVKDRTGLYEDFGEQEGKIKDFCGKEK